MENITTDIFSFENLRKDGFVYVDKTDMLWRLVSKKDGRQFFIARLRWEYRRTSVCEVRKKRRSEACALAI